MKLAIISDIHEDIVSLRQALHKIEKLACDEIVCLGDISGFSVPHYRYFDTRNAHECLKLVRENCNIIIIGNHDLHASKSFSGYCPEFVFPENWYSLDYHQRKTLSNGKVWLYDHDELNPLYTDSDIEYLCTLPELQTIGQEDKKILCTHYIYPNLSGLLKEFYHEQSDFNRHFNFMEEQSCEYSFVGHAHSGGLFIATENKIIQKAFNRKYYLIEKTSIVIPSIAGNQMSNGFCIFDTDEGWVKAVRV